jgi:6-pyruvoyltetrahydropterin/6-carboxytetrahydropterin synthase
LEFDYSIRVYKQYFNFACAHFLVFEDGTREPLHGHNYRVQVKGEAPKLTGDLVFDFLDIKPIVRKICDSLDHKLLLPKLNPYLNIQMTDSQCQLTTKNGEQFSFPKADILLLPLSNTSAERLAIYLCTQIREKVKEDFQFEFSQLEVEVEETPGQSAVFIYRSPT